ncbi:MAG: VOC family protein [Gemmatimonadetes bacterium]|nr:VOC family protein [Gemmatimonadota bacterium]
MKQRDRQIPAGGEIYLDHVGWLVSDMERASATFERLGFVLTPFVVSRNADSSGVLQPSGTGNRCAMLHRGYLELIAAIEGVETSLARQHRAAVARHVGLHVIALTVADAVAAHGRLASEGFEPGEPVRLRRPILAPDGADRLAEFTVIRVPPEKMPEGRIQILTQETPDLVWQPRLIARENGIAGLEGVLLCVEDPAEVAERYGRFTGRSPSGESNYMTLALDRGRLEFVAPGRCRSLLPGVQLPATAVIAAIALTAEDPEATRRFLLGRGVAVSDVAPETFSVGPGDAMGAAMVVCGADRGWPG